METENNIIRLYASKKGKNGNRAKRRRKKKSTGSRMHAPVSVGISFLFVAFFRLPQLSAFFVLLLLTSFFNESNTVSVTEKCAIVDGAASASQ